MTQPPNPHGTVPDHDSPLDPHEAAVMLDQTTQQGRRRFQPNPPLLNVFRAFVVLAAFGSLWLSVRGRIPTPGPAAGPLPSPMCLWLS
jgi:hypothetical protein